MQAATHTPLPASSKSNPAAAGHHNDPKKDALRGMDYASGAAALRPPTLGASGGALQVDPALARGIAREFATRGVDDENLLTDQVFYRLFPWLAGEKLAAKSPEAKAWVEVRDRAVRVEIAAFAESMGGGGGHAKGNQTNGGGTEPDATDDVAPGDATFHGTGADASTSDAYRTQNDNTYDDDLANWAGGSAGKNTCNMTAVAMALISIAGSEDVAKQAVAQYLRKHGARDGASAKVGKKVVALTTILGDSKLLAQVQLEDLCIAAATAIGGSYDAVTMTSTMLSVAKKSGLVADGKAYASSEKLVDPAVFARAKTLLAEGKRVVVGTVNHYVYLTAVRDDGILVHDPAGARVSVSGDPKYLWPGKASDKLGHWDGALKNDALRQTALRRVAHNPETQALFAQEAAALDLTGDAKKAARERVKQDHPGVIATGANNFYGLDELAEYNCRIRVILEPTESDQAAGLEGKAP